MAATPPPPIQDQDLKGLKYFQVLAPLLERLHDHACERDRAGNRLLRYDQYACLLLLVFFNPILKSLRGLQQASGLAKVQRRVGGGRVSRGALSEASRVFDPELLHELIGPLAAQALPLAAGREAEALRGLTAVDGSLLPALPKMAWALWLSPRARAAKMHVHFDVLRGVPTEVTVTAGNDPERDQWRATWQPGGFYVVDRGYRDWELFQEVIDAGASFVARVQDNTVILPAEERPLTAAARAAGVVRDVVVEETGGRGHRQRHRHRLRLVVVDTGKRLPSGAPELLFLCTDRLDLDAELVALAYRYRWAIELFFRWLKCVLGCRHLLAHSYEGVTMQVYLAVIASLLVSLWVGRKPTLRTLEMLQLYFAGWATEDELMAHLEQLPPPAQPPPAG